MTLRILLLAGLDEPLTGDARGDAAALAFELASALALCAADTGEIAVDLVARRGSRTGLPLVGVDPSELAPARGPIAEEALLCQVGLSGLLEGYDIVHSLLPAVAVLQIAAAQGSAIVQTVAGRRGAAAGEVLARIVDSRRLAQVREVGAGVDLTRFRGGLKPALREHLLWSGAGSEAEAREVAAGVDLPLRTLGDGDVVELLQEARALLHLAPRATPFGAVWPLRALACGTPVLGWEGAGLEALAPEPLLGALAPRHDVRTLIARARALPPRAEDAVARRELCLARHGARAMVGRYREVYRELASAA